MSVPILKCLLTICDFCLLCFLLSVMIEQFKNNYSLKSWASIFHIQCLIWLFLRGCFWLGTILTTEESNELYLKILYWLPCPFEYGAFLLLPLFFAQVLFPREFSAVGPYIFPAFVFIIISMILVMLMWVYYTLTSYSESGGNCLYINDDDRSNDCAHLKDSGVVFRILTAVTFLTLAAFQAVYATKLYYLDTQQYMRFLISSPQWIGVLNIILIVSFASRGIYQVAAIFNIFQLPSIPLLGWTDVGWIDFLCFEMWYIVPTVLLITTLTGKSLGRPETSNVVELELAYIESPSSASRLYTGLPTTERPEGLGRDSGRIGEHREYGAVSAGKGKTLDLETQRNMSTEEAISLYGLNRFESPTSLRPSSTWLAGLSGSIFEDKDPTIVGSFEDKHTPPEISRLTHHINRNAAEIEYYSRQRRGNSFGDANGFSEHEKSEISSLVLPTSMSSSWKAKTYLSGGAFVRGIESMDFKSITPDIDHQQRTHSPVKDHATKVQRDDVSVKTGKLLSINSTGSIASASGTASVSSTVPSVVTAPASASAVDSACRPAGPDARDTTSSGNTNSKRMEPKKRTSEGFL